MSNSSERNSPELRPTGSSGGHSDWSLPLVTQSSQSQDELSELRTDVSESDSLLFKSTTLKIAYQYTQWEQAVPISTKRLRPNWTAHPTLEGILFQQVGASLNQPLAGSYTTHSAVFTIGGRDYVIRFKRCQSATTLWLKLAELDDTMLLQENQEDLDKAKQTFFSNLEATDDVATRLKRHWEQVETKIPALLTYMNSREEQAEGSPS